MQGQVDIPLNEKGLRQARMAAQYFRTKDIHFDKVYTSPLVRAMQTAIMLSGLEDEVLIDERLIELGFGIVEGRNFHEIPEVHRNFILNPPAYVPAEGGESLQHLFDRCKDFLDYLAGRPEAETKMNILVTTHGAAIRGFLKIIDDQPLEKYWIRGVENCGGFRVGFDQGTYKLEEVIHTLPKDAHMHGWQN
jgi:probable phosphoglycerate mutase